MSTTLIPFDTKLTNSKLSFYFLWMTFHLFLFFYGYQKQKNNDKLATLNSIGYSVFFSRGAGLVMAFDMAMLLIPVCRNLVRFARSSRLNKIIPFDHNIYFHKATAYALLFFVIIHTNAHYANFFAVEIDITALKLQAWQVHFTTFGGSTGHGMLFVMLMIFASARASVRHIKFELFWYLHQFGFFVMYMLFFFHAYGCFVKDVSTGKCEPYYSWAYALPGFLCIFLERFIREYRYACLLQTNIKELAKQQL